MRSSSTSRTKDLFLEARGMSDAQDRARFLTQACDGDAEMLRRVQTLLEADAGAEGFLDTPAGHEPTTGDKVGYFGDYVLLDEIARGSNGVVFRARQVSLDRVVALKMLRDRSEMTSESDVERLRAEAKAAAALDHPNILPIYEVGSYEGQPYFSMKLVTGGTLQFRMTEYQQDMRRAVSLMSKVARAVQHAHEQGVLHRDLKPGNILIDANGDPHITDFGLARRIGIEDGQVLEGQLLGTPHYMSPEQARGETNDLTPAADIYSLGAMLYELLAGRRAFVDGDLTGLLKQVVETPPPPLPASVPPALARLVMRCLQKRPSARPGIASELADALEAWLKGGIVRKGWFPWKPTLAAVAVVLLGFGVWAWWDYQRSIIRVTTLADELDAHSYDGDGISLREALRDAQDRARIRFSLSGKLVLSAALGGIVIDKSMDIVGTDVVIHAAPEVPRTLTIAEGVAVALSGLTLTGESTTSYRRGNVGAIENNGSLTAQDCVFINNGGGGNGGAITSSGSLTLRRCRFEGNTCHSVGGAVNIETTTGPVRVEQCVFIGNQAYGKGGGAFHVTLFARNADVRLTRCTFTDNACLPSPLRPRRPDIGEGEGGAIRIQTGRVVLEHCIVAGNRATKSGTDIIAGSYTQAGPNFIGADPKDAPAGLGADMRR